MTDTITTGSILFENGTPFPACLRERNESTSNGWAALQGERPTWEKAIQEAGWTFFYMAGEMKASVFGFDRQKALRGALKRLIVDAKSQRCNSVEITQIQDKSFCKFPYVSVSAHARHLQQGMYFSG